MIGKFKKYVLPLIGLLIILAGCNRGQQPQQIKCYDSGIELAADSLRR